MVIVNDFLGLVRKAVESQDGLKLAETLCVEPPVNVAFFQLGAELRTEPRQDTSALEALICAEIPEDSNGNGWPSLTAFLSEFLTYWRDAHFDDLIKTHSRLSSLVTSCATALAHPTYGSVMLRTSINLSRALAKLTRTLHKQPDLIAALEARLGDQDGESKSLVEMTAEIMTKIFTTCLNDRSSARFAPPHGKKKAVYQLANMVLKLLSMSRQSRLAQQLFTQLANLSPPLKYYPASQRVTYLYYLGRFNFVSNHFIRAAAALEEAYLETPPIYRHHRYKILTYLIPANMLIGRLPTEALLSRPEAEDLADAYRSLGRAVRLGSFVEFSSTLARHENMLFRQETLLVLSTRLRTLVWRSLARRVFMLTWSPDEGPGMVDRDVKVRRAATLRVQDLVAAANFQLRILRGWRLPPSSGAEAAAGIAQGAGSNGPFPNPKSRAPPGTNPVFMHAVTKATTQAVRKQSTTLLPPPNGQPRKLKPLEGIVFGDVLATNEHTELLLSGIVAMGWMRGYMSFAHMKFAVSGGKAHGGDALSVGWPAVWDAIVEKSACGAVIGPGGRLLGVDVPGWIVDAE